MIKSSAITCLTVKSVRHVFERTLNLRNVRLFSIFDDRRLHFCATVDSTEPVPVSLAARFVVSTEKKESRKLSENVLKVRGIDGQKRDEQNRPGIRRGGPIKSVSEVIESAFLWAFGITLGGPRRPFPCPTPWNRRNAKGGLLGSRPLALSCVFGEQEATRGTGEESAKSWEKGKRSKDDGGKKKEMEERKKRERGRKVNRINDTVVVGIQDQCRSRCASNRFEN
ncbi:hypothetical protein K0M31_014297 [Melipona bicolor]|uniref:Uncharacterized protein n=1 Tax=Melipona bicolor TaxID=60889 RepID=A0AA40KU79_9HYME|nr:hypothetical protein K0M31_014297 [Melipona bicolor]